MREISRLARENIQDNTQEKIALQTVLILSAKTTSLSAVLQEPLFEKLCNLI